MTLTPLADLPLLVFMFKPPQHWTMGRSIFWDFCLPLINQRFRTDFFDPDKTYSADTIFYYDGWENDYGVEQLRKHLEQGYRIVFDNKNERISDRHLYTGAVDICNQYLDQCFWLVSGSQLDNSTISHAVIPLWFWSYDYLNFKKYQDYHPRPANRYKFLMLIRRENWARDYLYQSLGDILYQSLHSYWHRGITIPGDTSEDLPGAQREINPPWYDATSLSLVVESDTSVEPNIFITEKTFKPMVMYHPYIIYGQPGSLAFMRTHGFETFPELWDESYDSITDLHNRVESIYSILRDFDPQMINQPVVKEKLLHNHNRFFDRTQAENMYFNYLVEPLYKFANE